jgi:curved DNA-binding protein CbpA
MDSRLLPYSPERDVYRLLGIPSSASADEITAACRRLARTFHPDRNGSRRATEEMQVVNAVRTTLTDPALRARYDRERWRFHADIGRAVAPARRAWEPIHLAPATPSAWQRYARAAVVGLRSAMAAMLPPRCRGCRTVIGVDDAYCAACGTPRLTGG